MTTVTTPLRLALAAGGILLLAACGNSDTSNGGENSYNGNSAGLGTGTNAPGGTANAAVNLCSAVAQSLMSNTPNTGSTIASPEMATDQNLNTYATLTPLAVNGGGIIRNALTAMQTAGTVPGLDLTTPATMGTYTFTITTFLGNVQQEASPMSTLVYAAGMGQPMCGAGDVCLSNTGNGTSFFGFTTTKAYDSFQVTVGSTGTTTPLQLRELCLH